MLRVASSETAGRVAAWMKWTMSVPGSPSVVAPRASVPSRGSWATDLPGRGGVW